MSFEFHVRCSCQCARLSDYLSNGFYKISVNIFWYIVKKISKLKTIMLLLESEGSIRLGKSTKGDLIQMEVEEDCKNI